MNWLVSYYNSVIYNSPVTTKFAFINGGGKKFILHIKKNISFKL